MAHVARTHIKGERLILVLSGRDATTLHELLSRGRESVRVIKRARALELLSRGKSAPEAADAVGLDDETVRRVGRRYLDGGLDAAIRERPRPGQRPVLNQRQEAKLVALACWSPPLDRTRWTIALLRQELLRRRVCSAVSETTIRKHLRRHALKPWREKSWCVSVITPEYVAKMDDVLKTYERPYNPKEPVICFDEKPIVLREDVYWTPSKSKPGVLRRRDHEYARCGTANVFCAVEPKAGHRLDTADKAPRRTRLRQDARCGSARAYPKARKIHLVMDDSSTHTEKSLIDTYGKAGRHLWHPLQSPLHPKTRQLAQPSGDRDLSSLKRGVGQGPHWYPGRFKAAADAMGIQSQSRPPTDPVVVYPRQSAGEV